MGNQSLNLNKKNINDEIKNDNISTAKKINQKRKKELLDFLLSNTTIIEELEKNEEKQISNTNLILPFSSKFDNHTISSHFILISNDIIIVPTKHLYKINQTSLSLSFPQIEKEIDYDIFNFIIDNENDSNNKKYTFIKVLNKDFLYEKYFEIPDDTIDIESSEKFFINLNNEEESLGINIPKDKNINQNRYYSWSPIYIKKNEKLFLIGIIDYDDEKFIIFNKKQLIDIKNKKENIELKYKLYHIKKLDFNKQEINDNEMNFIFHYDYINLEYLDLQNQNLSNKGIKALYNMSLSKLKYLNLSGGCVSDDGLKYLNPLWNLDELILLKMNKLSDNFFLSLEKNNFIRSIKIVKCDKAKLLFGRIKRNFINFEFPNLISVKIIDNTMNIHFSLKNLFLSESICSKLKELDISNSGMNDNGMLRLAKNISALKEIKLY